MRNTRLYYVSDVYITYYYISKRNFHLAAERLRETLRCVKELRDPVVRPLCCVMHQPLIAVQLLRVVYSAFLRLAVHQERAEGIRPHFSEVPADLDEHEFFYGQLRW